MTKLRIAIFVAVISVAAAATYYALPRTSATIKVRIFHAAGLSPLLDQIRDRCRLEARLSIQTEASGSQEACRKLTELGRDCDLICLADNGLVTGLLNGHCRWRIDFATDRLVLAVGKLAKNVAAAEQDWPAALVQPNVRLARVDENLAPIGYCTLLAWKLQETDGSPGLCDRLVQKCDVVVDDVSKLPPLLKSGQVDYAIMYSSTAIAHSIRSIELSPQVNLGQRDRDYGAASVTFRKLSVDSSKRVTVRGKPIVWTLSIPDRNAQPEPARRLIRFLLIDARLAMADNGLAPLSPPVFYGPRDDFGPFTDVALYGGLLTQ